MTKLLLHTCCGPCFLGAWEELRLQKFEIINLFYNPNIQPKEEYQLRRESFQKGILGKSKDYIESQYNPKEHFSAISGLEKSSAERCRACYRLRLAETAETARSKKINLFSTTLLVSPYQDQEALQAIGAEVANQYQVEFMAADWRPHFRNGQNQARHEGLYRQKYCGCLFSREETQNSFKIR